VICILINANDPAAYDTADILPGRANWGSTSPPALPDNARNLALASHVLGHVDDGRAPGELYRILIPSDSRDSAQGDSRTAASYHFGAVPAPHKRLASATFDIGSSKLAEFGRNFGSLRGRPKG